MAIAEAEIGTRPKVGMPITEDELMRLPNDGHKYELVDGRLTAVPTEYFHEALLHKCSRPLTVPRARC